MGIENPVHLIFLAAVALLVLGPKRLPELARTLGKGIREFRDAVSDGSVGGFVRPHDDGVAGGPAPPPPEAEAVVDGPASSSPEAEVVVDGGSVADAGPGAVAGVGSSSRQVDPAQHVRSGDAPDRRSL